MYTYLFIKKQKLYIYMYILWCDGEKKGVQDTDKKIDRE